MKILIFNWRDIKNPKAGGAEVFIHEIAKRLILFGNEISLFTSAFPGCLEKETVDGIKIIRAGNKYTVYYQARKYYNKYFKGYYDIVIDEINTIPFFTPKFVKNGEKIFVLIHQLARELWFYETNFPVNFIGRYFWEDRWLSLYKNIPTITVSESTKKDLEIFGFKKVFIIPEGINFEPLSELPEKEKDPTLIFVGRLKKTKNPQDAVHAYKNVKKEIPNAKLWVIGDGYLRKSLEAKADTDMKIWGQVTFDKRNELMRRAHVLIVPGIREGWGLVVTEANAMGTPAVGYNVQGLRDSIKDNVTGLLSQIKTPKSLSTQTIRLLKDKQLYMKLSENALQWSRSFSWEKAAVEFLNVIQKCIKEDSRETQNNLGEGRVLVLAEVTMPPLSRANLRVVKLVEALSKANYPVTMLTPSFTPFSRRSYYQNGFHLNQFGGFCKYMYSNARGIVRLWHLIGTVLSLIYIRVRFNRISVIHAWNPLAGLAATVAGKILRVPVYIDFTDFYSDIAKADSPLIVSLLKHVERWILLSATKIFVVSRQMREELKKWRIDPKKIYIVPDGADSNMFHPSISGQKIRGKYGIENKPLIVYHGDIKEADGVDLLYYAFVKIRERIPDVRLMIIGGGGKYFRDIVRLGKELGIHSDIIYTNWICHEEVPAHLAAADVGAMPMRATLNHNCYVSFKLFEYWGVGKPVVVSRLKAISEIVVDGHNGLMHDPGDIEGMIKAYCELLTSPEKARKLGQNGRHLIDTFFKWENLMSMEVQAYQMRSSLEQENVTA